MKIVGITLAIVLCLVGIFAALLFTHKIPAAKLAKASPAVARLLTRCGLLKAPEKLKTVRSRIASTQAKSAAPAPEISQADADEKQSLDAERQQVEAEQAALNQSRADAAKPADAAKQAPLAAKLADIYDSMSPDDLARIFAKQADNQVVLALTAMDEKKAGKVMAALPADRAAKLAVLLNAQAQPETASAAA